MERADAALKLYQFLLKKKNNRPTFSIFSNVSDRCGLMLTPKNGDPDKAATLV